jgi:xanthine dehydrogenase accessory factor
MKRALLEALQAARAEKRSAVLLIDLVDGQETLVLDGKAQGAIGLTAEQAAEIDAAIIADRSGPLSDGRLFVRVYNPPLRLIVVGAVHIAQALAPMAELAGYDVTVVDPRRAWATDARFPNVKLLDQWPDDALSALAPDHRTAVVTLTHDPKLDDPALSLALNSRAFYIAALGSRKTHGARLKRLQREGFDEAALARIHGPAGLAIGAKTPAEIAVAILGQMTQVLRAQRSPEAAEAAA